MKKCIICNSEFQPTKFNPYQCICFNKKCRKIQRDKKYKEWLNKNREHYRKYQKKYKKINPPKKRNRSKPPRKFNCIFCNKEVITEGKNHQLKWCSNKCKKEYLKIYKRIYERKTLALKRNLNEIYTPLDEEYTKKIFNYKCFKCQTKENLQIDHHYPLSKGYVLTRTNAVLLCNICNIKKRNKMPEEFYSNEELNNIKNIFNPELRQ